MRNSILRGLLLALVVAMLSACTETPEGMVTSAKEYLAKGDQKAAVIQLRSALQKNPALAEARFLLGAALLDTGEFPASEKELRKALELEYPADQVVPTLVRAMVAGGQYKAAIDEFGTASISSPQGTAELQSALGQAYFATGNAAAGKAAFEAALAAQPDYPPAILGVARQKAAGGDVPGALASIDAALAKSPKFAEGWVFKGDLAMAQGQPDGALAAYRKAVELRPDFACRTFHTRDAAGRSGQGRRGRRAAGGDEKNRACSSADAVPAGRAGLPTEGLCRRPRCAAAAASRGPRQSAGSAPCRGGGLRAQVLCDRRESNLATVLNAVPNHSFARRLLIRTYLQSGQPAKALEALKPVLGMAEKDPALLALAGRGLSAQRPARGSREVLHQDGRARSQELRWTHGSCGQPSRHGRDGHRVPGTRERGGRELGDASGSDPDQVGAGPARVRQGACCHRCAGKEAAEHAARPQPERTGPPRQTRHCGCPQELRAGPGARRRLLPAAANLARLDLADKKPEDAKKRFDAVLAKDPKNVPALLALAELRARSGGSPDEVAALIEKAIAADPTAVLPRLDADRAPIAHQRCQEGRGGGAGCGGGAAQQPGNPSRRWPAPSWPPATPNQALASYNKLIQLQPNSPVPLLLLARRPESRRRTRMPRCRACARRWRCKPDLIEAQRGNRDAGDGCRARAAGRRDGARGAEAASQRVDRLRARRGRACPQEVLERGCLRPTVRGSSRPARSISAVKLHEALDRGGQRGRSRQGGIELDQGASERPDVQASSRRERRSQRATYATAASHYRELLELAAEQPGAAQQSRLGGGAESRIREAIEYAEKANKLAPDQPDVLDTLGTLLVEKGDKARGIELLRKASKLAPDIALDSAEPRQGADQRGAEGCREEGTGRAREAGRQVQGAGRSRATDEGDLSRHP